MKNKSKSAYTNIWLRRNPHLWCEKERNHVSLIVLLTDSAPRIVRERIEEINQKRRKKALSGPTEIETETWDIDEFDEYEEVEE